MSNTRPRSVPSASAGPPPTAKPSAWAGWIVFGAMVMILLGAFQAITGTKSRFMISATAGSSKDSRSITWHQWQAE